MLIDFFFEKQSAIFQILCYFRIGIFHKFALPWNSRFELAIFHHRMQNRQIIFARDLHIVFAVSGRYMDNTCAVLSGHKIPGRDKKRFLLRF